MQAITALMGAVTATNLYGQDGTALWVARTPTTSYCDDASASCRNIYTILPGTTTPIEKTGARTSPRHARRLSTQAPVRKPRTSFLPQHAHRLRPRGAPERCTTAACGPASSTTPAPSISGTS